MPRLNNGRSTHRSKITILEFRPKAAVYEARQEQTVEISKIASRCSFRMVHEVVSALDETKRQLVREIGFEGLLHFPLATEFDRKLALTLMCRIDTFSRRLVMGNGEMIPFDKSDVGKIFGIPTKGKRVDEGSCTNKGIVKKILTEYLEAEDRNSRSIKPAIKVITKEYNGGMTEAQKNSFKVAFVIYIMTTVLCPGYKHDYASYDYWSALDNPSMISSYNWSEYVIEKLLDGVVKLKSELKCNCSIANITGCALFIQVLYLDSADLGLWNLDHSTLPRIQFFSSGRARSMILADSKKDPLNLTQRQYLQSPLRSPTSLCYHWARASMKQIAEQEESLKNVLSTANRALLRMLHINADVDSDICAEFNRFNMQLSTKTREAALKYLTKLMSLTRPIARRGMALRGSNGEKTQQIAGNQISSITTGELRRLEMHCNSGSSLQYNKMQSSSSTLVDAVSEVEGRSILEEHFKEKMTALRTTHDPNSPIILHYNPKYIEVKMGELVSHMIGEEEFSIDLFNSLMRRLNQKNQRCTFTSKSTCNRHYFEAEFLQSIMEGDFNIEDPYIKDELVGSHLNNHIQQCSMLYFPAKVQNRWILYTWEMNINEITVFDPLYNASTATEPDKIHYSAIRCLKRCMTTISKKILKGWRQDFEMVRIKFMDHYRSTRECLSGLMCSYFCMTYNGYKVEKVEEEISKCCVAAMVLCEVISIEGNSGSVPSDLTHGF